MDSKSPEAFRTISEVSKDLSLPQHVLRFWETKFDLLNVTRINTRRHYRQKDIDLLVQIKGLLQNDKYTIEGANQKLNNLNMLELQEENQTEEQN